MSRNKPCYVEKYFHNPKFIHDRRTEEIRAQKNFEREFLEIIVQRKKII